MQEIENGKCKIEKKFQKVFSLHRWLSLLRSVYNQTNGKCKIEKGFKEGRL